MAKDCIPRDRVENYKLLTAAHYYSCDRGLRFHSSIDDLTATRRVFICTLSEYLRKQEDADSKMRVQLSYCYYWENPKRRSMKRLIAVTSSGQVYYDLIGGFWGTNKDAMCSVDDIDMEHLLSQCFKKYRVSDMKGLSLILKEKRKEKAAV